MEAKFTKGEWRFSKEYNLVTVSEIGIVEGSKTICNLNKNVSFGENEGEMEANAKLIAAAPELFETLKFSRYVFYNMGFNESVVLIDNVLNKAIL